MATRTQPPRVVVWSEGVTLPICYQDTTLGHHQGMIEREIAKGAEEMEFMRERGREREREREMRRRCRESQVCTSVTDRNYTT